MSVRLKIGETRADQNTGGALLRFPMRTDMHGKSRLSSAISFSIIYKISSCFLICGGSPVG